MVKPILENCICELLHSSLPNYCIRIADLGCSSGPNTFSAVLSIIENIDKACHTMNYEPLPIIQVFLNDLFGNDFNTVFKALPNFYEKLEIENGRKYGSCLIAAMPGSFYGRLFPKNSMHFLHSSYSLHWLSQVPDGLVSASGIPMNKGSIYIEKSSPPIVHQPYLQQFTQDFTMFLKMRYEELVPHGHLLLTIVGKNEEIDGPHVLNLLGMVLNDMVVEGHLEEEKLDNFNIPQYTPSIDEIRSIIQKEGSFKLLHLETFKLQLDASFPEDHDHAENDARAAYVATYIRAVFEPILASHFGNTIMGDLFQRFAKKIAKLLQMGKGIVNNLVISLAKECEN
ncbi:hypothetical protein ACH5RR_018656 [Cinchona calisaya]|uniref:Uncharacterized protein n=1 Tax=Cinchona calisaya TaxID=153742 RepID=A0ABD2ZPW5_9GENT